MARGVDLCQFPRLACRKHTALRGRASDACRPPVLRKTIARQRRLRFSSEKTARYCLADRMISTSIARSTRYPAPRARQARVPIHRTPAHCCSAPPPTDLCSEHRSGILRAVRGSCCTRRSPDLCRAHPDAPKRRRTYPTGLPLASRTRTGCYRWRKARGFRCRTY